ncbi:hypothetical protein EXIGLDRAFT_409179 [Exidia glandulosa HHB12029]|uniref:Uncharacterized protein n=1 Tax=Exidia glandulosa HHB12029 TaxID=1314781 RepID=A0A165Z9N5_EXIGL|nr:hypothetical protein EXIGLDRAFT_409179 [Exidia glandulosa HHB12029]
MQRIRRLLPTTAKLWVSRKAATLAASIHSGISALATHRTLAASEMRLKHVGDTRTVTRGISQKSEISKPSSLQRAASRKSRGRRNCASRCPGTIAHRSPVHWASELSATLLDRPSGFSSGQDVLYTRAHRVGNTWLKPLSLRLEQTREPSYFATCILFS